MKFLDYIDKEIMLDGCIGMIEFKDASRTEGLYVTGPCKECRFTLGEECNNDESAMFECIADDGCIHFKEKVKK